VHFDGQAKRGLLILGATLTDLTTDESLAFGQALATQVMRSLDLIRVSGH
jgi:hypothetical protein